MSQVEINKITKAISKAITTVPGLIGLVNKDSVAKTPKKLDIKNLEKGISVLESVRGYVIGLYIIVSIDVRTEIVAKELSAAIKSHFKTTNHKVRNINIYVKGVK